MSRGTRESPKPGVSLAGKDPEEVKEGKRFSCRLPTDLAHISDILASTGG